MVRAVSYQELMAQPGGPGSLRDTAEASSYSGVVVGLERDPDPCGHIHRLFDRVPGERFVDWPVEAAGGPFMWRVVAPVTARLSPHRPTDSRTDVILESGTLLRHDQYDEIRDGGCAMFSWWWDRFAVLSGEHAGDCVEFEPTFPRANIRPAGGEFPGPPDLANPWRAASEPPRPRLGEPVGRRGWLGLGRHARWRVEPNGADLLWYQSAGEPDPGYVPGQRIEWQADETVRGCRYYPLAPGLDHLAAGRPPVRIWRLADVEARGHYRSTLFYTAFTIVEEVPASSWYGGGEISAILARIGELTVEEVRRAPIGLPALEPGPIEARRAIGAIDAAWRARVAAIEPAVVGRATEPDKVAELNAGWWAWARARHAAMSAVDAVIRRDLLGETDTAARLQPWLALTDAG